MNDVRKMIWGTIGLFFLVLVFWISIIYVSSCGLTLTCKQALPKPNVTPIPTLIPAAHSELGMGEGVLAEFDSCLVAATDLVGAWVDAGSPETDSFAFNDINGNPCEGTFTEDVQPLFVENSLWYPGAIGCVSCHNGSFGERSAGLDMTSFDAILKGSGRADENTNGNDILGGGKWSNSTLYKFLVEQGFAPAGHSTESVPVNLVIYAGHVVAAEATATP